MNNLFLWTFENGLNIIIIIIIIIIIRGFFKAQIVLTNNQSVGGCISIYLTGRCFLKNKMNEHVIGQLCQLCFYLLVAVDFFLIKPYVCLLLKSHYHDYKLGKNAVFWIFIHIFKWNLNLIFIYSTFFTDKHLVL